MQSGPTILDETSLSSETGKNKVRNVFYFIQFFVIGQKY